jgi:hypothetical protein
VNARLDPSLAPWLSNFLFIWVALYLWSRTVRELPLLPSFRQVRRLHAWLMRFKKRDA